MESLAAERARGETNTLSVAVLGPPLVRWGARVVAFRTRKEFALLAYLALTGAPQPREHLAALFWPDQDAVTARGVVRTTLSRLRGDLAAAGGVPVEARTLFRSPHRHTVSPPAHTDGHLVRSRFCGHPPGPVCGIIGTIVCGIIGTIVCGIIGTIVCGIIGTIEAATRSVPNKGGAGQGP